ALIPTLDDRNLDFVGEFGRFYEEQKHTLDISDDDYKKSNTVAFKNLKRLAVATLTMRAPMMEHLVVKSFAPNFLDNPFYRDEMLKMTFDRIVNGVDARPFGFNNTTQEFLRLFYEREQDFLKMLTLEVVKGINVPGNLEESDARKEPYSPNITTNPNIIPKEGVVTTRFRHLYIFAGDTEETPLLSAEMLIEKRQTLKKIIDGMDLEIEPFTQAHVNAIFGFTKEEGLIPELAQMKAETYTMKDVANLYKNIDEHIALLQNTTENSAAVRQGTFLASVYIPVLRRGIQGLIGWINDQPNTEELMAMNIETFTETAKGLFERNGIPVDIFFKLAHENIRPIYIRTANQINATAQQSSILTPFRPEMEAQLDMITEILLSL
ncbi:MAG: hypothetical protein NXH75_10825, partial [Halobacteriovoraceae bacterium]|nr:hypothetical protein [Halobacteriovoraceae bacterium]